jgi:hypothetical protein
MNRIDHLLANYRRHVSMPLRAGLPFPQRVWFLVYPPEEERRVQVKRGEFELATQDQGLEWVPIDLTGSFAAWMDTLDEEEREACLADPEVVEHYAATGFKAHLGQRITDCLKAIPTGQAAHTVVALFGLMDLYDFIHVSVVINDLGKDFPGVLLVFFPGERHANTYRFLGARHGWDYLAVPILAEASA